MTDRNGPTVRLRGDVRTNSHIFGLPVVDDDGYNHSPLCYWCDGTKNSDTCPRSVSLREYSEGLRDAGQPAGEAQS